MKITLKLKGEYTLLKRNEIISTIKIKELKTFKILINKIIDYK